MLVLALNWKMAPEKTIDAVRLSKTTLGLSKKYKKSISCIVCPPTIHLLSVLKASRGLILGAQHASGSSEIAQTGLTGAGQLRSLGVRYCIVGHSEVRERGETNEMVAAQIKALLEKKISPILCIGEKARDHQGWYLSEVKDQIESVLSVVPRAAVARMIIAYEPVWAIGTKAVRQATVAECREMIIYIRKIITDFFDSKTASAVTVLYGGSVDEKNAYTFIKEGEAQGLLVGRVSLDAKRLASLAGSLIP